MKRTSKQRLLLFLALFHLFSDVAYAGGAVLCIGPNDHREVESEHVADLGCRTAAPQQTAAIERGASEPSSEACIDSPLHSDEEILSQIDDGADLFMVGVIAHPREALGKTGSARASSGHAPSVLPALRAHRTTVLVI